LLLLQQEEFNPYEQLVSDVKRLTEILSSLVDDQCDSCSAHGLARQKSRKASQEERLSINAANNTKILQKPTINFR
jgi:hypothetical protein